MTTGDFSETDLTSSNVNPMPKTKLFTMFRLGLFQLGLGMMSVMIFGVLNRVLIRELGVPATLATVILALTLFVAPARVWFGQLSDTKPLWGLHRTGYVLMGATAMAVIAFISVQVMWQVGSSLQTQGWTGQTYAWTALLALLFGCYGVAVSAASTPFATLLVDVTDEEDRSRIVGVDWSMLIAGTSIGGIVIGVLLRRVGLDASLEVLQAAVNRLFLIVPLIVVALAWIATWNVERKYSRYTLRVGQIHNPEQITLGRAWRILTANRQTQVFFTFLIAMTMGLFMQDPVLETYGAEVFDMAIGSTAMLTSFWGIGTLFGIIGAGFLLAPRIGKRNTAKWGCILTTVSLIWIVLAGFTGSTTPLIGALLFFGLASGITTTGAVTLMLDLTAAETAGTFIGAWGLAQALARGISTIAGGAFLDLGRQLTTNPVLAYSIVFVAQGTVMVLAIWLLSRVNVQEFQTNTKKAIAAVLESDLDG